MMTSVTYGGENKTNQHLKAGTELLHSLIQNLSDGKTEFDITVEKCDTGSHWTIRTHTGSCDAPAAVKPRRSRKVNEPAVVEVESQKAVVDSTDL